MEPIRKVETASQPKHLVGQHALARIDFAIDGLEALAVHIAGEPTKACGESNKVYEPALAEYLSDSPQHMSDIEKRIVGATERLRDLLF